MGDGTRGFDPKRIKQIKEIIIFTAIITLIIMYSGKLGNLALFVIDITMPFIIGAAIAFIINMPMKAIEEKLLKKWTGKWAE